MDLLKLAADENPPLVPCILHHMKQRRHRLPEADLTAALGKIGARYDDNAHEEECDAEGEMEAARALIEAGAKVRYNQPAL